MSFTFLSHVLSESTPGFGGGAGFQRSPQKRIARGDSSNSDTWTISNHIGTHIDAPKHFVDGGATIDSFNASEWVFRAPALIDLSVKELELIGPSHLEGLIPENADLVLLRTGFEGVRFEEAYWRRNPGFVAATGAYFRERFPNVRALGFDFISLTSFGHRQEGREAHQAFLDPSKPGNPILIIEDMALASLVRAPIEVIVAPLRVGAADGAPVTVFARI